MASRRKIARATRVWSNLPPEVLSTIAKLLDSNLDILRCRSVCKNWRTSMNPNPNSRILSPILPLKITNSTLPFTNRPNETLILFARTAFLIKPLPSSINFNAWILTVEEVIQGKLRILYPLSKDYASNLPSNFPKSINLLDYSVCEISKSYGFKYASDMKDVLGIHVVLCSDSTAMVLYGEGSLIGLRINDGNWGFVFQNFVSDVIIYKGLVCALDLKGYLHSVDHKNMKVDKTVSVVVKSPGLRTWDRKRLVEHNGKLWLVTWPYKDFNSSLQKIQFMVYRLGLQHRFPPLTSLQGWSLFVSGHWCFIVRSNDLNVCDFVPIPKKEPSMNPFSSNEFGWFVVKGDYLVYSQSCFDSSAAAPLLFSVQLFDKASVNLPIGISYFRREDRVKIESLGRKIAGLLWPPPSWLYSDTSTFSSGNEMNGALDSRQVDVSAEIKEEFPSPLIVGPSVGAVNSSAQDIIPYAAGINLLKAPGDSKIQDLNLCASTEKFEGVYIKSNLVLTLKKIWAKHGNILEGSTIRSGDFVARALESLATAVLILQSSSGQSLNEVQADYLSSTMADLQNIHFKVDWLVPFVEKALAVYRSKPLFDSLKKFDEAKARLEEVKLEVLNELAKLDELEDDMKSVYEILPDLTSIDPKQSLGEGIC